MSRHDLQTDSPELGRPTLTAQTRDPRYLDGCKLCAVIFETPDGHELYLTAKDDAELFDKLAKALAP